MLPGQGGTRPRQQTPTAATLASRATGSSGPLPRHYFQAARHPSVAVLLNLAPGVTALPAPPLGGVRLGECYGDIPKALNPNTYILFLDAVISKELLIFLTDYESRSQSRLLSVETKNLERPFFIVVHIMWHLDVSLAQYYSK